MTGAGHPVLCIAGPCFPSTSFGRPDHRQTDIGVGDADGKGPGDARTATGSGSCPAFGLSMDVLGVVYSGEAQKAVLMTQPTERGKKSVLSVTDFGPIAGADVDLRPLTILAGPGNTGKSHLAMLIYALSQCFSRNYPADSGRHPGLRPLARRGWRPRERRAIEELWRGIPRERKTMFVTWLKRSRVRLRGNRAQTYPDFLQDMLRDAYGQSLGSGNEIEHQLKRCFGIGSVRDLTRDKSRAPATANVTFFDASGTQQAGFEFRFGASGTFARGVVSPGFPIEVPNPSRNGPWHPGWDPDVPVEDFSRWAFGELFDSSRTPHIDLVSPAHFFPAARGGLMHSYSAIVESLARSAASGKDSSPVLSGTAGDFLMGLMDMGDTEGPFSGHAKSIETGILGGEIRVERDRHTGHPVFFYRPRGRKTGRGIPLGRSSAMVSELAAVVLYLRYVVDKGDLLIIEEPEAHLHPAAQAELAVHVARLVKAGLRVIIVTHSQYMAVQFANLVSLSVLSRARQPGLMTFLRRIEGADLDRSMVGAWLFESKRRPAGTIIREIPFDSESGTFPLEFGEVSLHLHNEGAIIENISKAVLI